MEERSADPILQRRQHGQGATNAKRQMIKVTVQPGGHQIKLRIWSSTLEVKQQMGARLQGHVSWMRLLHNNVELLNSQLLIDLVPNVKPPRGRGSRDSSGGQGSPSRSLTFWLKVQNPHDFDSGSYLHTWGIGTNAAGAAGEQLLTRAQQGLQIGLAPQLSLEGSGGTYLLRDTQKRPVAAFKPRDEEPFAPNNPRGLAGKMGQPGIHPHVASGDAHIREVLAFRLDWGGFASVPCTLQVEGRHPALHVNSVLPLSRYGAKVGSLQAWVKHDDTASDRGTATFPVHEVHKIAILDMRLLNSDRHDSNLLVVDREKSDGSGTTCELVPIDHGGCLPSLPEVNWFNWCWLSWPQMKVPLSASDAAYVANLDVKAEEKLLTELGVPARPRRALYCSTMLLQRGVAAGLSLLEVASLMCRGDEDEVPSELERLWTQAERLAYSALHNHRLRGCSDSFSSAPASRGATPLGGGARASSPSAAPGAATATTVAAATAEEDDLSAVSTAEDTAGEATPPKKPTPSTPRGGHRRTASGDVALARTLPMGSPKPPRRKMERWSEGEIEPSSPQIEPQTPPTPFETPNFRLPALTGIKRVISTSTLMDIASYSTLAADRDADATHAPAEEPGTSYPHTRRLSMGAASEDPDGAVEASFLAYFERMLDDMVERHVSRRDREQPAAPPEAKSPRNSRNSQGPAPLDAEDFFETEVIFETSERIEAEVP
uniref:PI3K/PI4K catalytic domain-containing protein n=1 Tax=Phaeocystis antarctica TaxID=33657 RepID=A0A7S0DV09_9EUKA|mmetsp:Transcript_10341/g.24293  ORF Transcript_10341/g.24293 Transcript_10341/m.24293 type:complete len:716 (+) Transcript_10341:67-2214(+)